ncbi:hypothetical protein SAMD00019534_105950 [Acytostelium subglobosum LB1]|uniref:hypothetical protein n=1 Tax=Acytostelium subglobosum LB1 TaxID=1410327 RepID=UPI000644A892|nr:hypothetical protein SAMD00019534_105950 [Acytostelium subglobosum LB1]GAM27419.1 hypothetical protein SAMD00019534_105950 [Acytostelium subglobosum LB1]|eukprot:XP_012749484.1 hypothetical protein SAMD00019534_105950 [Acytostelium subglobosum LB1]
MLSRYVSSSYRCCTLALRSTASSTSSLYSVNKRSFASTAAATLDVTAAQEESQAVAATTTDISNTNNNNIDNNTTQQTLSNFSQSLHRSTTEQYGGIFPHADNQRPQSIEELILTFVDPYARPAPKQPYYRFTEPRDGYTVETFLKKIGRGCDAFVEKFPTWEDLMTSNSKKMKHEMQIPVQNRKWILHWVEQWKQGRNPVLISKSKSIAKKNTKK